MDGGMEEAAGNEAPAKLPVAPPYSQHLPYSSSSRSAESLFLLYENRLNRADTTMKTCSNHYFCSKFNSIQAGLLRDLMKRNNESGLLVPLDKEGVTRDGDIDQNEEKPTGDWEKLGLERPWSVAQFKRAMMGDSPSSPTKDDDFSVISDSFLDAFFDIVRSYDEDDSKFESYDLKFEYNRHILNIYGSHRKGSNVDENQCNSSSSNNNSISGSGNSSSNKDTRNTSLSPAREKRKVSIHDEYKRPTIDVLKYIETISLDALHSKKRNLEDSLQISQNVVAHIDKRMKRTNLAWERSSRNELLGRRRCKNNIDGDDDDDANNDNSRHSNNSISASSKINGAQTNVVSLAYELSLLRKLKSIVETQQNRINDKCKIFDTSS